MTIKITGALPTQLKDVGIKPGMIFNSVPAESTILGARKITWQFNDEYLDVVIYPENYFKV